MLTWCSRAVNLTCLSFRAASRTRASPFGPLPRLGVRCGLGAVVFSLACGLSSATSSGRSSPSFGNFVGTTPQYDSPWPCMEGLWFITFPSRSARLRGRPRGLPVLAYEVSLHALVLRLRGAAPLSRWRATQFRLPFCPTPSASLETHDFGAQ